MNVFDPGSSLAGGVPLIAGLPGGAEWIILLVVLLLLFGGSRLAGIGKGTGRAIREFKEETKSLHKDSDGKSSDTSSEKNTDDDVVDADVVDSPKKTD